MRLTSVKEIKAHKDTLWLVRQFKGEFDIWQAKAKDHSEYAEPFAETEFGWAYENQPIGLRKSDLADTAVFTTLEEAKKYVQECINGTTVEENPAGDTVGIYKGSFVSGMTAIGNDEFDWTSDDGFEGMLIRQISLNEIYKQAVAKKLINASDMLTVFLTTPLNGFIYQCGNYRSGNWVCVGTTKGYA